MNSCTQKWYNLVPLDSPLVDKEIKKSIKLSGKGIWEKLSIPALVWSYAEYTCTGLVLC